MYQILFLIHIMVVVVQAYRYRGKTNKYSFQRKCLFVLVVIAYVLLATFKPLDLVPDSQAYFDRFHLDISFARMATIDIFERNIYYNMSFLVSWIFWLGNHSGLSYYAFMFIIVSIQCVVLLYFSYKIITEILKINLNLYELLFLDMIYLGYAYQFVAVSEGFAIILGVPAVYYLLKKKYILAYVLAVLSVFMHSAGVANVLVLLVLTFTGKIKKRYYLMIFAVFLLFMLLMSNDFWFDKATQIISFLADNLLGSFVYNTEIFNATGSIAIRNIVYYVQIVLLFFVNEKEDVYWKFLNVSICAIVMMVVFANISVAHRIYDVFIFYSVFPLLCFYEKPISTFKQIRTIQPYLITIILFLSLISRINVLNIF